MPYFNTDNRIIYGLTIVFIIFLLAYPTHILLGKLNKMIL